MKSFGTESSIGINSPASSTGRSRIGGIKDTNKASSQASPGQNFARFSALGDEAFENKKNEIAVNFYMQSVRLLTPKHLYEGQLDLRQCKKYCVLTSILLKVAQAYLQDKHKEEAQKSLNSAEVFIRKVIDNDMDKENVNSDDISIVEYSSYNLLSKVMERHGDAHLLDGDFTRAEEAFQESIIFRHQSLNIMHSEDIVSETFNNMIKINLELATQLRKIAAVLQKRGDYRKSATRYNEALKIMRETRDETSHKEVVSLLTSLVEVFSSCGQIAAGLWSLDLLIQVLKHREESKELLFSTILKKVDLYIAKEEYVRAMEVATDALDMVNSQGLEYNEMLLNRANATEQIAKILVAQAQFHDAIVWHKRALSIRSEILPRTHQLVQKSMTQIAHVYCTQGDYDRAKVMFKDMRNWLVSDYGVENSTMADLLDELGSVYSGQKDLSGALRCHQKSLEIRRICQNPSHSDFAITLEKIALLCLKKDRVLAMKYFSEALHVLRKNHYCRQHPSVIRIIREMTFAEEEGDTIVGAASIY